MTAALALIGLGLPIGFLIGLIGIGGVLLTPALVHLFGLDIHASISLSRKFRTGRRGWRRARHDGRRAFARGRLGFPGGDRSGGLGRRACGTIDPERIALPGCFGLRGLCRNFLLAHASRQK
jgi:hypothetical protein